MNLEQKKPKLLFATDFCLNKTGFARMAKVLLTYLYNKNKYQIYHYAMGVQYSNPILQKTPWISKGSLPDNPAELENLNKNPHEARNAGYGAYYLDKIMLEIRPDFVIYTQDYWGCNFCLDKKYFNKIPFVIWVTIDSLPLLPEMSGRAPQIKDYWVWAKFSQAELHRLGHKHVKCLHGPVDDKPFFRLTDKERNNLRARFQISNDCFIVGMVFRNQLRKLVPNLMEGFKLFKQNNPKARNSKLFLFTSFREGWGVMKLAKEYNVDPSDILAAYLCHACGNFEVKPYQGEEQNCRFCNSQKSQFTPDVNRGITESQLNEVYNLMDVYCHPFTSGGQEIPCCEAKFAELITLINNYSCGEDLTEEGSGSLILDYATYREHGTEFIKASVYPSSISKQLTKVLEMDPVKKREMGKQAREWALKNYSIDSIGPKIEQFLDSCPVSTYDWNLEEPQKNPDAIIPDIKDDSEWIKSLYKEILKMDVVDKDEGKVYWEQELKKGVSRQHIEAYFRQVGSKHNLDNQKTKFEDLLNPTDKKRVLVVLPESLGDVYITTSLFESIRKRYPRPEWTFYFATKPENFEILEGNPYIDKLLQYIPEMDNLIWLEGQGTYKGFFDVAYPVHFGTQRLLNYLHQGEDLIDFNIKEGV